MLSSKSILDMTENEFARCLNVDLFAAYWVCSFIIMKCFFVKNKQSDLLCSIFLFLFSVNSSNSSVNDET
jgi:hypothetical protein